jgi:hypothetical protein
MTSRVLFFVLGSGLAQAQPALPYFDWKACPFEGCTYRQWTALKPVVVYDTWKQPRRPIAKLAPGGKVRALRGVVITYRPGVIRMDRDWPESGLKRGDTILTYAYGGESAWAAWVHGRYDPELFIPPAKRPEVVPACRVDGYCAMDRSAYCFMQCAGGPGCLGGDCAATQLDLGNKAWWAEVTLPSGRTGWINVDPSAFQGIDLLAAAGASKAGLQRTNVGQVEPAET